MKVALDVVINLGERFHINWKVVKPKKIQRAIEVEIATRRLSGETIANTVLLEVTEMAVDNLKDCPDYYDRLLMMKYRAKRYWGRKGPVNIFN